MRYLSLLIGLLSVCITITSQAQNIKTLDDPNIEVRILCDGVQIINTSPAEVSVFDWTVVIGQRTDDHYPQPLCCAHILDGKYDPVITYTSFGTPKQGLREKARGGGFYFHCTIPPRNSVVLRALVLGFGNAHAIANIPKNAVYKRVNRNLGRKHAFGIYAYISTIQTAIDNGVTKEEDLKSTKEIGIVLSAFYEEKFPEYVRIQAVISEDFYKQLRDHFSDMQRLGEQLYKTVFCE
jgi:hypothetical protein